MNGTNGSHNMKSVYILILNWNGWGDTIECLESVFRLDYPNYRVIVCDNASSDGSLGKIQAWAEGRLDAYVSAGQSLRHFLFPPLPKPIYYAVYDRIEAETGGKRSYFPALTLIQTGANLGFAGGNNVGLRHALARDDFDFVWLLNNDTVVKPDALTFMVKRMAERPDAGMCGSLLPYYDEPLITWASGGGVYNRWLGRSNNIDVNKSITVISSRIEVETSMVYLAGASMLVLKKFILDIGLMTEDYFLFYEEIDWSMRGKHSYSLAFSPESRVYHKVGRSIGTAGKDTVAYQRAVCLTIKNRILFTARFFPIALPTIMLICFADLINMVGTICWNRVLSKVKSNSSKEV